MIRNLNQLNFQGFGTVSPERPGSSGTAGKAGMRQVVQLQPQPQMPVFRTLTDTWMGIQSGMTVLSVALDGKEFQHFYLDKPVCLHGGVYYTLSPFGKASAATVTADQLPEQTLAFRPASDFRVVGQLRLGSIYTFFYQEREKGFCFSGESHPMVELTYVDHGSLHSVADGQDLLLEQGDMAIYGPEQWHMQYADTDVAASFVTITFDLEGMDLAPLLNRKFTAPEGAVGLLRQMLRELDRQDDCAGDMILCLLSQLLITLKREKDAPEGRLRMEKAVHSENEIIRKAQQYISSHIREKLTVPVVAKHVQISTSYLTALFHKHLQISPGEYIRRIKLQESKQMIRENNMSFTQIAAILQYSTVHHFSRQFKEKFGITPTEYAKSIR